VIDSKIFCDKTANSTRTMTGRAQNGMEDVSIMAEIHYTCWQSDFYFEMLYVKI
jgi:hypothetical protein